jgi:hypothetical protein
MVILPSGFPLEFLGMEALEKGIKDPQSRSQRARQRQNSHDLTRPLITAPPLASLSAEGTRHFPH